MNNFGMLWFDNDPKTALGVKIQKAAAYFKQKYGRVPELCLVNPSVGDVARIESFEGSEIAVRTFRAVLPGHLWIGMEELLQNENLGELQ